jgi:hypothetical protein
MPRDVTITFWHGQTTDQFGIYDRLMQFYPFDHSRGITRICVSVTLRNLKGRPIQVTSQMIHRRNGISYFCIGKMHQGVALKRWKIKVGQLQEVLPAESSLLGEVVLSDQDWLEVVWSSPNPNFAKGVLHENLASKI